MTDMINLHGFQRDEQSEEPVAAPAPAASPLLNQRYEPIGSVV